MKRIKRMFACTLVSAMFSCLSVAAQTLVFHLPDGGISKVEMPCTFTFSATGDKLIIDGKDAHVELQRDHILSMTYRANRGDSNGDMTVDVADIATIISIMSGTENGNEEPGTQPGTNTGEAPENAKGVDLGLPSGLLWANMNIGATSPQEDGLYFAWGETTGYTNDTSDGRKFDWASYKWMTQGKVDSLWINKYQIADGKTEGCWYQYNWDMVDYEFIGDGNTVLDPEDDAAAVNWGGDWRMPTIEDFDELLNNTTNEWITVGTVSGRKFTSKTNGNSIFLPAAGGRSDASLGYQGTFGWYWSSSLRPSNTRDALSLYFYSGSAGTDGYYRYLGRSVRAVLRK